MGRTSPPPTGATAVDVTGGDTCGMEWLRARLPGEREFGRRRSGECIARARTLTLSMQNGAIGAGAKARQPRDGAGVMVRTAVPASVGVMVLRITLLHTGSSSVPAAGCGVGMRLKKQLVDGRSSGTTSSRGMRGLAMRAPKSDSIAAKDF